MRSVRNRTTTYVAHDNPGLGRGSSDANLRRGYVICNGIAMKLLSEFKKHTFVCFKLPLFSGNKSVAYSSITAQLYTFGCGVFSVSQRSFLSLNPESHLSAFERNSVVGFGRNGPRGRGGRGGGRGAPVFYRPGIAFLKQPQDPVNDEEHDEVQDDIAQDDYHNLGQRQHGAPPLSDRRSESVETSEDISLSEFRPRLLQDVTDGVAIKKVWMVESTLVIQLVDNSLHFTRMVNSFMTS